MRLYPGAHLESCSDEAFSGRFPNSAEFFVCRRWLFFRLQHPKPQSLPAQVYRSSVSGSALESGRPEAEIVCRSVCFSPPHSLFLGERCAAKALRGSLLSVLRIPGNTRTHRRCSFNNNSNNKNHQLVSAPAAL